MNRKLYGHFTVCALLVVCAACSSGDGDAALDAAPDQADAGPSGLDPSYGQDGIARFNIATAELLQSSAASDGALYLQTRSKEVIRLAPDGTLDTNFGEGGTMAWPYEVRFPLYQLSDGRWLSFSECEGGGSCIARFDAALTLDTSFGVDGYARIAANRAAKLRVAPQGRLLVLGGQKAMYRFSADGQLDTSFGTDGFLNLPTTGWPQDFIVQGDGRIVVLGSDPADANQPALLRLGPDGASEASVPVGPGDPEYIVSFRQRTDGNFLLFTNLGLVRVHGPDLQVDTSFGNGGSLDVASGDWQDSVALTADDGFLLSNNDLTSITVHRYLGDATLDPSFVQEGVLTIPFASSELPISSIGLRSIVPLNDGRFHVHAILDNNVIAAVLWP